MKHRVITDEIGDPCPRCRQPTEVREHITVNAKHLRQPYYYRRWHYCVNKRCRTTFIMPERYRVWNDNAHGHALRQRQQRKPEREQQRLDLGDDVVMDALADMKGHTDGPPPWEGPDTFEKQRTG
jgi:hypothetical protein